MTHTTAALVLCAGKGTRMKSQHSKLLHQVCGKPLCFWALDTALSCVNGPVVAVIGHQSEALKESISAYYGKRIVFALQKEAKGTGDAVRAGLSALKGDEDAVLVTYGDVPLLSGEQLKTLITTQRGQQSAVALLSAHTKKPHGYGRIVRGEQEEILQIVEEADASPKERAIHEINVGTYVFGADFLRTHIKKLEQKNQKGEFYLTDLIGFATQAGEAVLSHTVDFKDTVGVNDRLQLSEVSARLRTRINTETMLSGATLMDPASTYIDADVIVGEDVILEPGVILQGKCVLAKNVVIGAYSILRDCIVQEGAHVKAHSVCEGAKIGPHAEVGPFARLRAETVLDRKVKIGNFVEVKKSHFHEGAKANHLAYIGDADIGATSNVGAGTITCNYDGNKKHKTTLGEGVFIGSNSTLVAPITIAAHAYVGAGSVITQDVPADALALGRARQENKLGYAKKLK